MINHLEAFSWYFNIPNKTIISDNNIHTPLGKWWFLNCNVTFRNRFKQSTENITLEYREILYSIADYKKSSSEDRQYELNPY